MEDKKIPLKTLILVVSLSLLVELILVSVLYYEFVAIPAQKAAAEMTLKSKQVELYFNEVNKNIESFQKEFNDYKKTVDEDITSFKGEVVQTLDYLGFTKRTSK